MLVSSKRDKNLIRSVVVKTSQAWGLINELKIEMLDLCEYGDFCMVRWITKVKKLERMGFSNRAFVLTLVANLFIQRNCPRRLKRFNELLKKLG